MVTLATFAFLIALPQGLTYESRTLLSGPVDSASTYAIVNERIVYKDSFTLVTRSVDKSLSGSYSILSYSNAGVPMSSSQEGNWNDRWNILETKFGPKECVQLINGEISTSKMPAGEFANPTSLWFWKVKPKVGTVETVKFLAQNTIATFSIRFTYEGDEEMTLAGRKVKVHRVREKPLSAPDAVYTIWWYDDQGMGVKRVHKTTQGEYNFDLHSWR